MQQIRNTALFEGVSFIQFEERFFGVPFEIPQGMVQVKKNTSIRLSVSNFYQSAFAIHHVEFY